MAISSESGQMLEDIVLCDTHAHLAFRQFDNDREKILREIEKGTPAFVVEVGINVENSKKCVEIAESHQNVYASVGIHPHDSGSISGDNYLEAIRTLASSEKVVAIGEIGLDYYRDLSPRDQQRRVFSELLEVAAENDLPVIVHVRDAYEDAIEALRPFSGRSSIVVHSFSGTLGDAKMIAELGFFLGIGCPITYKRNNGLREAVRKAPLDQLLPETDSPFLPPQELRGKRNEPKNVLHVFRMVSELKGLALSDCSTALLDNARGFFRV